MSYLIFHLLKRRGMGFHHVMVKPQISKRRREQESDDFSIKWSGHITWEKERQRRVMHTSPEWQTDPKEKRKRVKGPKIK